MALSGRDLYVIGDDLLVQLRLGPRTVFDEFSRDLYANSAIAVSGDHVLISEGQDLALCETLNRYFDVDDNSVSGYCIPVADAGSVRRVRIVNSDQVGYLTWTIIIGGVYHIDPDEWIPVGHCPDEIAWGMTIHPDPAAPRNQPGCSSFEIEWLYDYPVIESIADIPGDQGGRVSLRFAAAHGDETPDLLDEGQEPVTSYALFRRYDEALPAAGDEGPRASYPPGEWHYVMDMPAMTEDGYSLVVPTLADSNEAGVTHSVFFVRSLTATPGVFFDSPPDSGYSVDNLAPNVPEGLVVEYAGDGNDLAWLESEAEDFRYFKIYRGSTPDFTVDPDNPAHMTTAIAWTDPLGDFEVYYKVAAVDFAGNESPAASPTGLIGVGGPPVPFALLQNVPNPFNPRTVIAFSLSEAAAVTLRIFDLSGREVARLLDAAPHDPGSHEVSWEGRDGGGRRLAAGTYIYRLETAGRVETRRMMLVK